MGNILLGRGDTAQAIIAYKQAIDCNPSYARPYLAMAEVYAEKGEKEMAMNNYLATVRLFAEYDAYEEIGIYAAKALKLDSTHIEMERYLRHYYYKMEDHAMVLQIGLNIDELSIAQNNAEECYANRTFMAMSLYKIREYEEALYLLSQVTEHEETVLKYGYLITTIYDYLPHNNLQMWHIGITIMAGKIPI